jgi:two-component sensor histidine kinase
MLDRVKLLLHQLTNQVQVVLSNLEMGLEEAADKHPREAQRRYEIALSQMREVSATLQVLGATVRAAIANAEHEKRHGPQHE